jgi:hypothetical protein
VIPTPVPFAICGVPGYAPPDGEGYHALVDGEKVYVPPELVVPPRTSSTPQSTDTTEVPATNRSLTKSGPPVKGWSWKVSARNAAFQRSALLANHNNPASQMSALLASTTELSASATALANSFAALAVEPPAES